MASIAGTHISIPFCYLLCHTRNILLMLHIILCSFHWAWSQFLPSVQDCFFLLMNNWPFIVYIYTLWAFATTLFSQEPLLYHQTHVSYPKIQCQECMGIDVCWPQFNTSIWCLCLWKHGHIWQPIWASTLWVLSGGRGWQPQSIPVGQTVTWGHGCSGKISPLPWEQGEKSRW